jgi:glycosyltransferase involved in cell wall biosynthesis
MKRIDFKRIVGKLKRLLIRNLRLSRPPSADGPEDESFISFINQHFDREWYLRRYPEVRASGIEPLTHWFKFGLAEGRHPGPNLIIRFAEGSSEAPSNGWKCFSWRRKDLFVFVRDFEKEMPFLAILAEHFDEDWYLQKHPDIAAAKLDPFDHWLFHGINEGRQFAPGVEVRLGKDVKKLTSCAWRHFTWRGLPVALMISKIPQFVMDQIKAQGGHDPSILSPGVLAIPQLPIFAGDDLFSRDGIDLRSILDAFAENPTIVIFVEWLVVGGAEKYAADLIDALIDMGSKSVLVLVTGQSANEAADWPAQGILKPFERVRVVFWRDVVGGPCYDAPTVLARLMNVVRPAHLVIINSHHGLEMVSKFGRGLSQFARMYCAFFGLGVDGLGVPYGVRYPKKTGRFSISLTDNDMTAEVLRNRYAVLNGPGISVLPPRVNPISSDVFKKRMIKRIRRATGSRRRHRWVWVSRIERFKGTAILAELARLRVGDRFDLFGPAHESLESLGLSSGNIEHRGVLDDVANADFSSYDGFVFTSLFEGMPNVVLEMSQHAIPMVLANVGGLRDTFDDTAAVFVDHSSDWAKTAVSFSVALDQISSLTQKELAEMATAARNQVLLRHAPEVHTDNVRRLFGQA